MIDKTLFGKDHWSTFAYLETRIVDHNGIPNPEHMRVDIKIHPQFVNRAARDQDKPSPPTRLNDGSAVKDHDDWSCIDDLAEAGDGEEQTTARGREETPMRGMHGRALWKGGGLWLT